MGLINRLGRVKGKHIASKNIEVKFPLGSPRVMPILKKKYVKLQMIDDFVGYEYNTGNTYRINEDGIAVLLR